MSTWLRTASRISLLSVVAVAAVQRMPALAGEVDLWQRYPVATAPLLEAPPRIDGAVEDAEWGRASRLDPLLDRDSGIAVSSRQQRVYVAYDETSLYVGVKLQRPRGHAQPSVPAAQGRIDEWGAGDYLELSLDPEHAAERRLSFVLYPSGAYADGTTKGSSSTDRSWNPEWTCAARVNAEGWEAEFAIPFASLGVPQPSAGTVWGFDIASVQISPTKSISQFAFRGKNWKQVRNLGHLRFGKVSDPAVALARLGTAGDGTASVELTLLGEAASRDVVTVDLQLAHSPDQPPQGFFEAIDAAGDDDYAAGAVEFYKGSTSQSAVDEALAQFAPVPGGRASQEVRVSGDRPSRVNVSSISVPGHYLASYSVRSGNGEVLAAASKPFVIRAPLAQKVTPYWLNEQKLLVEADLTLIDNPAAERVRFSLRAPDRHDGSDLATGVSDKLEAGDVSAKAWVSTRDLPPGDYRLTADLIDAGGVTLESNTISLQKPAAPAWHDNSLGTNVVPEPWTPLEASTGGEVRVWGRSYDLSTFLPKQIRSNEHPLLAAPVKLDLVAAGTPAIWNVESLELENADDRAAVYRGTLTSEHARLTGTATVEFDGFIWYDLELQPLAAALQLDHLTLVAELQPQHCSLMSFHRFLQDPVLSTVPLTPLKAPPDGVFGDAMLPFTPHLWVGNEQAGLAWIAEAPVDWQISKPRQVIEINRPAAPDGPPPSVRIHVVDAPYQLSQPRRLQFGLQASPVRATPQPSSAHITQSSGPSTEEQWYKGLADAGAKTIIFHSGWQSGNGVTKNDQHGGWPAQLPDGDIRKGRLKRGVELAQSHGLDAVLYTGWGIRTGTPEWEDFSAELVKMPIENSAFGTYRQSAGLSGAYADFMVWSIAQLVREYGIDGVFWDSTANLSPGGDTNLGIGNGWIDDEGRVRPTIPIRATRELFQRVYTLTHGEIKSGGQTINFGGSLWCINAYSDVFHRGEGGHMRAATLREAWSPLEDFRANFSGEPFGLQYALMNKNFKRLPMTVNTNLAVGLLHGRPAKSMGAFLKQPNKTGYQLYDDPSPKIWQARLWLPMDDQTVWHTYYGTGPTVADVSPDRVLCSVFANQRARRALVVLSNLDPEPASEVTVSVDLVNLGFELSDPIRVEDAVTGEQLNYERGAIKCSIESSRYRLLKVSTSGS